MEICEIFLRCQRTEIAKFLASNDDDDVAVRRCGRLKMECAEDYEQLTIMFLNTQ